MNVVWIGLARALPDIVSFVHIKVYTERERAYTNGRFYVFALTTLTILQRARNFIQRQ